MQHREPAKIPTSTMTRKEIEITIHQEEGKKKLKLVDPLEEQIFCSACSEILQEPYQVTCCGENLCMKCLGRIKSERDNCPNCSAVSYFGTRNDQLYEKIRRLRVHCLYEDRGCDWIGNIEELKLQHLNLEGDQEACQFVKIKCPYCHELVNFETINRHRVDICLQRPFACQYCLTYQSTFADIMSNHRYVCSYWALQCANDCGELIMQMDMNNHIRNDCPLTVLDCEFEAIGCTAELPREEMSYHMTNNVSTHMILMARALKDVTSKTEAMMESMKREMEQLKEENASLQKKMRRIDEQARPRKAPIVIFPGNGDEAPAKISLIGNTITVAELTMSSYSKNKRGNYLWYSPPFYNHQKGYRSVFLTKGWERRKEEEPPSPNFPPPPPPRLHPGGDLWGQSRKCEGTTFTLWGSRGGDVFSRPLPLSRKTFNKLSFSYY